MYKFLKTFNWDAWNAAHKGAARASRTANGGAGWRNHLKAAEAHTAAAHAAKAAGEHGAAAKHEASAAKHAETAHAIQVKTGAKALGSSGAKPAETRGNPIQGNHRADGKLPPAPVKKENPRIYRPNPNAKVTVETVHVGSPLAAAKAATTASKAAYGGKDAHAHQVAANLASAAAAYHSQLAHYSRNPQEAKDHGAMARTMSKMAEHHQGEHAKLMAAADSKLVANHSANSPAQNGVRHDAAPASAKSSFSGGVAGITSKTANMASANAHAATEKSAFNNPQSHLHAANAHEKAADLHEKAASHATDQKSYAQHMNKQHEHRAMAQQHEDAHATGLELGHGREGLAYRQPNSKAEAKLQTHLDEEWRRQQ